MKEKTINERLIELQDLKYKSFTEKLIPTLNKERIIGVRMPELRKLAKRLEKENKMEVQNFLKDLPHFHHEENNLHALLIENIKNFEEAAEEVKKFLPHIDNWATCDLFSPYIFRSGQENRKRGYGLIMNWLDSEEEYIVRFAIVMLLKNYMKENFRVKDMKNISEIKSDKYYVNMAIAWYMSTALAEHYDDAVKIIEEKSMDRRVHNKTIQKAVESLRINSEKKEYLKRLKI